MENVADVLKIVLAVTVFAVGLVLLFNLTGQAKETARVMIAEVNSTKYYNYTKEVDEETIDSNGNRIVELKDIIPVLYRYSEENYGVTIVDRDGNIVARFDMDTESICNNWISASNETKQSFVKETNTNVYEKVNKLANNIDGNTVNTIVGIDGMEELFKKIYFQKTSDTIKRGYYCYWSGNMGWTSQRIDSDLSRNICKIHSN